LAALFAASSLRAQDKPMGPPKPAAEMSQMAYFAGYWNCSGKTFQTPFGPEHATAGIARGDLALGGFRLVLHYDETKTAASPMPFSVLQVIGWNDGAKAFDSVCFDVFGGACTQTSAGWKGNTLVFEGSGVMGGQKMGARDTFTKVSATELTHKGEMQGSDGKWMTGDEESCKKAAKK
jgi:hypothetical protein